MRKPYQNICLALLLCSLFSVSCAGLKKEKSDEHDKAASHANADEIIASKATAELELMVTDAKKHGEKAISYLSSDLFLKANDASMRGDGVTSTFIYKYLVELNPDDLYLKKKYAVELIRQGKLVEAKNNLKEAYEKSSFDKTIGLVLGGVYTALNEVKEAQVIYQSLLKREPSNEEACVFLSKSYALEQKYKEAHQQLTTCEKRSPNKAIFAYYQGKISLEEQKRDTAMLNFERALKIDKNYYQAVVGIGLLHEEKENFDKAGEVYKSFLKRNPENYAVLSRYVQILFMQEKFQEVIPYAEMMVSLDPSDLNLKVRLGILYSDVRKYKEAVGLFKEILEVVPDSDKVLYYLGALYQQSEDFEQALVYYQKIIPTSQLYSDSTIQITQIMSALARLDYIQGGGKGMVETFLSFSKTKMKELKEIEIELAVVVASFYEAIEDYDRAIGQLASHTSSEKFTEGHTYYLASIYEKNREHQKARKLVYQILEKNPNNAHALNFIGYSMVELGEDMDKAFDYIAKAVAIKPDDGFIRDSLGWYFYKKGDYSSALAEMKKAFELIKDDAVIAKHLAMTYRQLKMYAEAKKYYVEALKNCKIDAERADVIKSLEDLENIRMPASKAP